MIPTYSFFSDSWRPILARSGPARRALFFVPLVAAALACMSCGEEEKPPPPVPVTDTEPVGSGLKVIGYAVLGAAVVCVLGRMLD